MSKTQPVSLYPAELKEGNQYLLRSKPETCRPESWATVRFVGYTACPAVVIVATEPGLRMPIAREDLFLAEG